MSDHDPECLLSDPSHFVTFDVVGEPFGCTCALIARVMQREWEKAVDKIEAFRVNLPEETKNYSGGIRSRDDMSWALAMVRDRLAKGKE